MADITKINWTHHTHNCWEGCTKCSPGCQHCYAELRDRRHITERVNHWGPKAPRRITSDANWRKPLSWDRQAAEEAVRHRVFCGSLMNWADKEAPAGAVERMWELIRKTPHLDWMLLTKRPHRIKQLLPEDWGSGYANTWLGTSTATKNFLLEE